MAERKDDFPSPPQPGPAQNLDHCYLENFQKIYNRKGLSLRKRLLCGMSALVATGDSGLLESHFRFALEREIPLADICETLLQTYLFIGFPGAYKSLGLLARVSGRKDLPDMPPYTASEQERTVAGEALCKRVYGGNYEKLRKNISGLDPDFASWMINEGYGKILSRPLLDPCTRELITVAALVATGRERQLRSHIEGALNLGCTSGEVREVILQTYLYAGFPAVIDALILFRRIEEKRAQGG